MESLFNEGQTVWIHDDRGSEVIEGIVNEVFKDNNNNSVTYNIIDKNNQAEHYVKYEWDVYSTKEEAITNL